MSLEKHNDVYIHPETGRLYIHLYNSVNIYVLEGYYGHNRTKVIYVSKDDFGKLKYVGVL